MSGEVRLVGTAHVGSRSREVVREVVREAEPDVVAVELDGRRYASIKQSAERSGFGVDMLAAVEEAEHRGIPLALIDRDVGVTLRRAWSGSSLLERLRIGFWFVLAFLGVGGVQDVDEVLENDGVEDYVEKVRGVAPGVAEALIDERDAVMARRLLELRDEGYTVVAVVGAGHERGIEEYLSHPGRLPGVPGGGRADVYERGDDVVVVLDLPGCVEESLEVGLRGGELVVEASAERPVGRYVLRGRPLTRRVGVEVPGGSVVRDTSYSDGVLRVRLRGGSSIEVS